MGWFVVMALSAAAAPPGELDTVVRALSSRDPVSCELIFSLTSTPVPTLLQVVDEIARPPWAPMRAASCLVQHHAAEIQPDLERWVVAPELKGLGRLVLDSLDRMPPEVAVPVARKALESGPEKELALQKISAAQHPEVRALAAPKVTP
jgi:hypothetical protein